MNFADRVKDTTTTTGTGPVTASGTAPAGFQALSAIGAVGSSFTYAIAGQSGGEWEIGTGVLTAANVFSRAVAASSNGNALVNFSAGTKDVFCTLSAAQIAKFNSSDDIVFSTAVPLTMRGAAYMPQQAVASVLAFTIAANPVKGALVYLRLVADGSHAPTFAGMKEWGGSLGYDNRNGIVNEVQFFYDGYDYWYSVAQAVGATAVDGTAPQPVSALVANSTPTIVSITYTEALDPAYVPATTAYTVAGHAVSAVAISGSAVNLTCTAAFVNGEAARVNGYTQPGANGVRDIAGNLLVSYSNLAITNNVGAVATGATLAGPSGGAVSVASSNITLAIAPVGSNITGTVRYTFADGGAGGSYNPAFLDLNNATPSGTTQYTPSATAGARTLTTTNNGGLTNPTLAYTSTASTSALRFSLLENVVESGTTPNFVYTGQFGAGGSTYAGRGILNATFPTGDATFIFRCTERSSSFIIGLTTSAVTTPFSGIDYGLYQDSTSVSQVITAGAPAANSTGNSATFAANDKFRFQRTGTTLTLAYSKDAGVTWVVVQTWNSVPATAYHIALAIGSGVVIDQLSGTGLV